MRYPTACAVVLVREEALPHLERALTEIRAQRDCELTPVLVDQTLAGELEGKGPELGATVLREPSPSRGLGLVRALEATDAEAVLVWEARACYGTDRARTQLAALASDESLHLVTCDLALASTNAAGEPYRETRALDLCDDDLPGLWHATVCVRRPLLATIDRAAFAPSEFGLWTAARASGVLGHVTNALVEVELEASTEHVATVRVDAQLHRLAQQTPLERPEITVLLATHNRCDILLDCIAGFARQLVRPGTLEIVVVDDASSDATSRVLPHVRTNVRVVYDRLPRGAGASAARNLGLPVARGARVLFVNDDTIPAPDLVRRHLEAHRELGAGAMVLGTFRQPDDILANALNRVLDDGNLVFGYAGFVAGEELPGGHFYTCNASVDTEVVRAIGAFDEGYGECGGEDTDIGLRLIAAGQRLFFRPECQATHRHRLSFEDFRRRQHRVARAHVRLYFDHPELVVGQPFAERTTEHMRTHLERSAPAIPLCESAARTLAEIDLDRVAATGGELDATVRDLAHTLEECVRRLHSVYWIEGLLAGFDEAGLTGFPDLIEKATARAAVRAFERTTDDSVAAATPTTTNPTSSNTTEVIHHA
ncbi:Hyaluronan synthase [Planctomycetes bacterium Pla163]|uniref:Hyaluronan synthase n=1 Tax=Rohdeia mirabilis TaxID=2528008 RepID=A0A518CY90_9BACT|nr:Hyaluronan synthase [Planctomycetes bacterium Pla163]